jgi:hypothetical protein
MIPLSDLYVMHADLRHVEAVDPMADFVRSGGYWNQQVLDQYARDQGLSRSSPLIQIPRFEDGHRFIHDGHHRVISVYLGGRNFLRDDEYEEFDFEYEKYLECNNNAFANGFFTPFDPRTELRLCDFREFKEQALQLHSDAAITEDFLCNWIQANADRYRQSRNGVLTVVDLYNTLRG